MGWKLFRFRFFCCGLEINNLRFFFFFRINKGGRRIGVERGVG